MGHVSGAVEQDDLGFYTARCSCGWEHGPLPDEETVRDVLMEHAATVVDLPPVTPGERVTLVYYDVVSAGVTKRVEVDAPARGALVDALVGDSEAVSVARSLLRRLMDGEYAAIMSRPHVFDHADHYAVCAPAGEFYDGRFSPLPWSVADTRDGARDRVARREGVGWATLRKRGYRLVQAMVLTAGESTA